MKKTRQFSAFGNHYKCVQFSAIDGLEVMSIKSGVHPCVLLRQTEIAVDEEWRSLADHNTLNNFVCDIASVLPPRIVLDGIMSLVHEFNFGFLMSWTSVKVPVRFTEGGRSVTSKNVEPMASQLIQDGVASLQQLEEYYSLEDAFKMFDTLMVKGVNQALSHEEATKKNKR